MGDVFDLKEQMTVSVKWIGIGQLISYVIQFVVWVVLARLLPPNDFGALSIALVFSNLAMTFNELGMASAIIQRKDLTRSQAIAGFWVCVSMGAFFAFSMSLASPLVASFFRNPVIGSLIIIFALKFLVDSFSMIHESLLQKELVFNKLMFIEIFSSLIYGLVAVSMAFTGFGILSMAWGYFAKSMVKVVLLWRNCDFRPSFEFDRRSFGELFHFGKNMVGFKILNYISGSIDFIFVGKLLGSTALGYYSMAMNVVNFPRQKLSLIISTVAFPAFSKIQNDLEGLRSAYLKIVRYMAVISFPLLTGLMVVSPQFVKVVYSSKWNGMILPLEILCVYGVSFSLTAFVGVIYTSSGHPEYAFKYGLVNLVGLVSAIVAGAAYGLVGIAASLSIYAVAMNVWGHVLVKNIIKLDLVSYFKSMAPAAAGSCLMVAGLVLLIWTEKRLCAFSDALILVSAVASGAVIYFSALFLISRRTLKEMVDIVRKMI